MKIVIYRDYNEDKMDSFLLSDSVFIDNLLEKINSQFKKNFKITSKTKISDINWQEYLREFSLYLEEFNKAIQKATKTKVTSNVVKEIEIEGYDEVFYVTELC